MKSDKLKTALSSIFKLKQPKTLDSNQAGPSDGLEVDLDIGGEEEAEADGVYNSLECSDDEKAASPFVHRALPPIPPEGEEENGVIEDSDPENVLLSEEDQNAKILDYAASIERVKNCGWYWGPVSGEMAEKLLSSEPDGSFIVRDSSDEHYIFSLTFKLNGLVRHVRIEHDQGESSFKALLIVAYLSDS